MATCFFDLGDHDKTDTDMTTIPAHTPARVAYKRRFVSESAMLRHVRTLVGRLPETEDEFQQLARFHPDRRQRHGQRWESGPGNKVYLDGHPFSWRRCVQAIFQGEQKAQARRWQIKLNRCWRLEVDSQIKEFRDTHGGGHGRQHVDHDFTRGKRFVELVEDFLRTGEQTPTVYDVVPTAIGFKFRDRTYAGRWQQFHRNHAKLRMLDAKTNLAGNRGFSRKRKPGI